MKTVKATLNLNDDHAFKNVYIKSTKIEVNQPTSNGLQRSIMYEYRVWPQSWGKDIKYSKDGYVRTNVDPIPLNDLLLEIEAFFNNRNATPIQKTISIAKILNKVGVFNWLIKKVKKWRNR